MICLLLIAGVVLVFVGSLCAIRQPNFGQLAWPEGARADPDRLRAHVEFLAEDVCPRNPEHLGNLNRAADYIREAFEKAGARVSEQPYTAGGVACRNVIGRFGPEAAGFLVIGAHYDVCGDQPGADDNASGIAGLLEVARLLGERGLDLPIELVAFSTEEPPFFGSSEMGSAVHARSLREEGRPVLGMICLEMIGYFCERQPVPSPLFRLLYPGRGDFVLLAGRWGDRRQLRFMKQCFRGATDVPACSYSGPVSIGTDLSDHRNYWAENIPAVMVTDTAFIRNPNYHTAGDTADTLDYTRMAGVVDGVLSAAIHRMNARDE